MSSKTKDPPQATRKSTRARKSSTRLEDDDVPDYKPRKTKGSRPAKKARQTEPEQTTLQEEGIVSYEWMGRGTNDSNAEESEDAVKYYDAIRLTFQKGKNARRKHEEVTLRVGDAVRLWSTSPEEEEESSERKGSKRNKPAENELVWICRIEALYSPRVGKRDDQSLGGTSNASSLSGSTSTSPTSSEPRFRGRWFYCPTELTRLVETCKNPQEVSSISDLLPQLSDKEDLVLSNLQEENSISTVRRKVEVVYGGHPNEKRKQQTNHNNNKYICRHRLDWDDSLRTFSTHTVVAPLVGDESSVAPLDADAMDDQEGDNDNSDSSSSSRFQQIIQEGEGSTLRANISVGPKYQAVVGPFVPSQRVSSRRPILFWKPNMMDDKTLRKFAEEAASAHTEYLKQEDLTVLGEPYTPLRSERAETLLRDMYGSRGFLTGSALSTSSSMLLPSSASDTDHHLRSDFRRECDADALLDLLSSSKTPKDALSTVSKTPIQVTSAWSITEREIFDDCYRKNHGNLRSVAKALAPTKSMKQVVDYFYRFKIPDQYRLYQNKKREQAVHLMECIEKKRAKSPVPLPAQPTQEGTASVEAEEGGGKIPEEQPQWKDAPVAKTAHVLNERRQMTKQLLLEVEEHLGSEVLTKIATGVQHLRVSYDRKIRDELLMELKTQPELQRRLLQFLPPEPIV